MNTLGTLLASAGHADVFAAPVRRDADLPESGVTAPESWLVGAFNGGVTVSGVRITPESAMALSAVFACVSIISETISTLPLHLYRRVGRSKERVTEHPLYHALHDSPNDWQTAVEFREMMQAHLCLRGNAYARIHWHPKKITLHPIHPDRVTVERNRSENDNGPIYRVDGELVPRKDMLHIKGLALSRDGLTGISPITYARESLGLAKVLEERGAASYGKGLASKAWIKHPGSLTDEQAGEISRRFMAAYGGRENAGGVAILHKGMELHTIDLSLKDAEFVLSRKFQIAEVVRCFRGVPLHLIGELDKATFSNIEHQALEFVIHCIRPRSVRWEQAIKLRLLAGQSDLFVEHNVDGLLRGDIRSRYQAYAIARQWGWMSANDICELENRNPLPGDQGDVYLEPMNMQPAGTEPEPEPEPVKESV